MRGDNTQEHIERFLNNHPDGHLYVAVGYASVWGLAWLQEHTTGRPVTLVIGDTKPHHFEKGTDSDRRKALAFLRRRDVRVLNWYRSARSAQGKSMLHAKAWVVADRKAGAATAALVGSANLTRVGLQDNWELMAVAAENEVTRIWSQLDGLLRGQTVSKKPWDASQRLIDAINAGKEPQPRPKTGPKPKKKGGCLPLAASIGASFVFIIAVTLLLFL